jgi:hypothetical protein
VYGQCDVKWVGESAVINQRVGKRVFRIDIDGAAGERFQECDHVPRSDWVFERGGIVGRQKILERGEMVLVAFDDTGVAVWGEKG